MTTEHTALVAYTARVVETKQAPPVDIEPEPLDTLASARMAY